MLPLRWIGWPLLLVLILAGLGAIASAAERTNVVMILADDLGWGDLSCYGHPKFKTPHIDRLAAQGTRLTNFHVPVPYCAPTRGSLITGRYPLRNGLSRNPFPDGDPLVKTGDKIGLPLEERTLADVFRSAGYATGCFGKWHLGHQPHFRPLKRGFDEYFGILYSNDMHPVELFDGEEMVEYPVVQATLTKRLTQRAVSFIERHKEGPFLLYFPQVAVHKPLFASEEFYGKSGAGLYADMVAELDWSVGQVLEKLQDAGLEEKTLVIFASDNGPWYGGSTGGLRGMKGQSWEGGLRVPCLARWPGRIRPGNISHEQSIMMDLFATALAAAKIPLPADRTIDGRSLLPLLAGEAKSPHEVLFGFRNEQLCTASDGRWKLHLASAGPMRELDLRPDEPWVDPRRPDGVRILAPYKQAHPSQYPGLKTGDPIESTALFDLQTDPGEQDNVARQHPDIVDRLRKSAQAFLADVKR